MNSALNHFKSWPLLLCLAALLGALGRPAPAQAGPWTVYETLPSFTSANSYVLWIKAGTTDPAGSYSGDLVSIWTVDAAGNQLAVSPTYGPYAGWRASQLTPAYDGTLRMAWKADNSDGTPDSIVSLWTLDSRANLTAISPTYGPYSGWTLLEEYANPDGTAALYWEKIDDAGAPGSGSQISIWTVDARGNRLSISPTYGPYADWYFYEALPSFSKDGTSFIAWVNSGTTDADGAYTGDELSLWKTDAHGSRLSISPLYGRYPGWFFDQISPAYDGTARLLWVQPGGADSAGSYAGDIVSLWSVNSAGGQPAISPTYGPFSRWTARMLVTAPSGASCLLWAQPGAYDSGSGSYSGDLASLWSLSAGNALTSISPTYAVPGAMVTGLDICADGSEHLAWQLGNTVSGDSATRFSLWRLNSSSGLLAAGPTYGPFP